MASDPIFQALGLGPQYCHDHMSAAYGLPLAPALPPPMQVYWPHHWDPQAAAMANAVAYGGHVMPAKMSLAPLLVAEAAAVAAADTPANAFRACLQAAENPAHRMGAELLKLLKGEPAQASARQPAGAAAARAVASPPCQRPSRRGSDTSSTVASDGGESPLDMGKALLKQLRGGVWRSKNATSSSTPEKTSQKRQRGRRRGQAVQAQHAGETRAGKGEAAASVARELWPAEGSGWRAKNGRRRAWAWA